MSDCIVWYYDDELNQHHCTVWRGNTQPEWKTHGELAESAAVQTETITNLDSLDLHSVPNHTLAGAPLMPFDSFESFAEFGALYITLPLVTLTLLWLLLQFAFQLKWYAQLKIDTIFANDANAEELYETEGCLRAKIFGYKDFVSELIAAGFAILIAVASSIAWPLLLIIIPGWTFVTSVRKRNLMLRDIAELRQQSTNPEQSQ